METGDHVLIVDGTIVALSGTEYRLLRVFLDHPQRVLNREQLLNLTQGRQSDAFDGSIDLLVSRLRQTLRDTAREPGVSGAAPDRELSARVARSIADGIGTSYRLTVNAVPGDRERLQVHLLLTDGSPLTIDFRPMSKVPMSEWLLLLAAQLALLAAACWLAVRLATHPLLQLARAADTLGPDLKAARLAEDGPAEVAVAAWAWPSRAS